MHKLPTNLLVICDWTSSLFQTKKSPPWTQSTKQNQSGFRPKRSTEDALLYMTTKWRKAINSGKVIRILFINFKKFRAHQILLKKLRSIRRLLFLPWELSPRPQAEYHCWQSYLKYCRCWLRCNSLVSPPCFSVYVNDLQEKLDYHLYQFADNSTLHDCGDTKDNVITSLQRNTLEIKNSSSHNSLTILQENHS